MFIPRLKSRNDIYVNQSDIPVTNAPVTRHSDSSVCSQMSNAGSLDRIVTQERSLTHMIRSPLPRAPLPPFDRSPSTPTFLFPPERPSTPLSPLPTVPRLDRNFSTSSFDTFDGSTSCPTPTHESRLFNSNNPYSFGDTYPSSDTFDIPLDKSLYSVDTLNEKDDVDLIVPWNRWLYRMSPLFTFLAVGVYFLYYGFRIYCTILAERAYNKTYIMAWFFIAAEGCVACKPLAL